MTSILVVDDEKTIRFAFAQFLQDEGYTAFLAADGDAALDQINTHKPEIVFLDYRLPGRDGLDLLTEIKDMDASVTVVFMTAFGEMDVAIKAMQRGAYEYLTKPLDLDRVRVLINRIIEGRKSLQGLPSIDVSVADTPLAVERMVGNGPAMQEVFKMIGLLTTQDVTVLITGESGVGKELVARAIHTNSRRCHNPFVAINCGAMPVNLIEAELFGYEKGAFTGADTQKPGKFEVASGGIIFLDEIGDLDITLQVKLLRVLQERAFERVGGNKPIRTDVRIIAATNKDLHEELMMGTFRKDLFYRLHLIHIHLPPLRERREDIPFLVEHFIRKANPEMNRQVRGVTDEAMKCLMSYPWPGNVRELENQIKRVMVLSREDVLPDYLFELDSEGLSLPNQSIEERLLKLTRQYFSDFFKAIDPPDAPFDRIIERIEKTLIEEALKRTDGNQVQAANLLGMHRSTLRKKIGNFRLLR
jgi:nitrogen regulation protein NR(I)